MATTWIVVDCNYLCYRAFFTTGHLSYDEIPTGVIFGFLRDVLSLEERFPGSQFAFCWDYGKNLRRRIDPEYKMGDRKNQKSFNKKFPDEQTAIEAYNSFKEQLDALRVMILPDLGYSNVLFQKGYEADDVIASVCENLPRRSHDAIIVSSDADLYQLLSSRVRMFNPRSKEITTKETFIQQWGLDPILWTMVKAIAGCKSDNIQGVEGVGEITAASYIRGELKPGKKYDKIIKGTEQTNRNLELVELPFPGTKIHRLRRDRSSRKKWMTITRKLKMESLIRER